MAVEQLTYAELAERLNASSEAARALVRRLRLPRSPGNDGKARITVDLEEIQHKPMVVTARRPRGDHVVTATIAALNARIEALQSELEAERRRSAGHRADFERERERTDRLVNELLEAGRALTLAREVTGRLEGELAILRKPWWRRKRG